MSVEISAFGPVHKADLKRAIIAEKTFRKITPEMAAKIKAWKKANYQVVTKSDTANRKRNWGGAAVGGTVGAAGLGIAGHQGQKVKGYKKTRDAAAIAHHNWVVDAQNSYLRAEKAGEEARLAQTSSDLAGDPATQDKMRRVASEQANNAVVDAKLSRQAMGEADLMAGKTWQYSRAAKGARNKAIVAGGLGTVGLAAGANAVIRNKKKPVVHKSYVPPTHTVPWSRADPGKWVKASKLSDAQKRTIKGQFFDDKTRVLRGKDASIIDTERLMEREMNASGSRFARKNRGQKVSPVSPRKYAAGKEAGRRFDIANEKRNNF